MENRNMIIIAEDELMEKLRLLLKTELHALIPAGQPLEYTVPGLTQKPIFKATEVCQMLQISRQTLNEWKKSGLLPGYKIRSRLFFRWEDIEALLKRPPQ
jgi:hypothetical protein